MAWRSSSNLTYVGSPFAVPVPAGATAGDIAVLGLYLEASGTLTLPSGFTLKYDSGMIGSVRIVVAWKRLSAADSGTYSSSGTGLAGSAGCSLFSGRVATGDPWDLTSTANATGTTVTCAALSPAASGDDLWGGASSFAGGTWTPPSGMTERVDSDFDQNSADNIAAGSTGTKTFTCSGSGQMIAWLGALLPAAGGGSPSLPELVMAPPRY